MKLTCRTLLVLLFIGCAQRPHLNLDGPYWRDNDTKPIPEPSFEEPSLAWLSFQRTTFDQTLELLDIDRNIRKITDRMTVAKNVNSFDEVPNSSWFTNRHGFPSSRLTQAEILWGPALTPGPDTSGIWTVFRPKVGGATVGFWIRDARGDEYIIKFDPAGYPELATAAAAMGSRFFHACGYNVPQETIVYWRRENLRIKEGTVFKDFSGQEKTFTEQDLNDILAKVQVEADGRYRSLASLSVGNVKGPFMYKGTRAGDANDWCPHEHRRELRGLYVIGSLINHYDLKDHNTMDVYVGERDRGYLKHYLMDFGSTFGSQGSRPKPPITGYANLVDLRDILTSLMTLGLKAWSHEFAEPWEYPSVGYFEFELFDPSQFAPIYPNPAFEQKTRQDGYWGAKIVMAFSDEDLAALVESGQFSDFNASEYLLNTLMRRRDKIGRYWFGQVNPLDFPTIVDTDGKRYLNFEDLAIMYGLESPSAQYEYEIRLGSGEMILNGVMDSTLIPLDSSVWPEQMELEHGNSFDAPDGSLIEVRIRTRRGDAKWSTSTSFWLYQRPELNHTAVVGLEHH